MPFPSSSSSSSSFSSSLAERKSGPSKEEVLQLLHNCELSGCSLASSTVPSRAPSPSPSLMSIMCPGYRPTAITTSQSGTPISTPLLPHNSPDHLTVPASGFSLAQATRMSGVFTDFADSSLSLHDSTNEDGGREEQVASPDVPLPPAGEQVKPRVNRQRSSSPRHNPPMLSRVSSDSTPTTQHENTQSRDSKVSVLLRSAAAAESSGCHVRARSLGSESCASDNTITPHGSSRPVSSLSADLLQSSLPHED